MFGWWSKERRFERRIAAARRAWAAGSSSRADASSREALAIARETFPPDDRRIGEALAAVGRCALRGRRYEAAVPLLEEAVAFAEPKPSWLAELAVAYAAIGNDDATRVIERIDAADAALVSIAGLACEMTSLDDSFRRALACRALELGRGVRTLPTVELAKASEALGDLELRVGRAAAAVTAYGNARARWNDAGRAGCAARARIKAGLALDVAGERERATREHEGGLRELAEVLRRERFVVDDVLAYFVVPHPRQEEHRPNQPRELVLDRSEARSRPRPAMVTAVLRLGARYLADERPAQALAAFELAAEAARATYGRRSAREAHALQGQSEALVDLEQHERSRQRWSAARAILPGLSLRWKR